MKRLKILINIDCRPDFTRIPKETIVEVLQEMPNGYIMVSFKGKCYPIPPGCFEVIE